MWRNFGYGGFGSYVEKLANRAGERELFQTPSMANPGRRRRGGRVVNGSEAGGELGKASWTTWRRSTAGKTGSPSLTATTQKRGASGGLRRHTANCVAQGEERERD